MPYADNQGIRLYYITVGDGPPLVLQHWSLATLESWYECGYVKALEKDYRLVLLDGRGHGASDKPHNPEAYALKLRVKDIVTVLDELGIDQAHFFGYSMGGWIGFGLARYVQERFKSLIIGGQHPYAQDMDGLRQIVEYGVENGAEAFVADWEKNFGALSNAEKERMLNFDYRALYAAAQDRESLEDVLPRIKIPCLLYAGEMDEVFPLAKKCSEIIENARFISLSGLDHGGAISQSSVVLPHLKSFLANVSQGVNAT